MAAPLFNVYVGSETGLLKGINTHNERCENIAGEQITSRDKEINVLCWNDLSQKQIAIGRREQVIDTYDSEEANIVESHKVNGVTGPFKGLAKFDNNFVICTESGNLKVLNNQFKDKLSLSVGSNICCMKQNTENISQVATGGKENDLKIWDLNVGADPIFKAKNVPNDWLNIRVPVWVTDIQFIGNERIVASTGTHTVRLYDPKSNRRKPQLEVSHDEYPFTSLAVPKDDNYVVVGNTKGNMALLDLRKKAMVHCYKGFAGSIRDIQCHPTEPIIASCGLDRFLRIHDFHSRKLLHKIYLKSRLNCLLLCNTYGKLQEEDKCDIPALEQVETLPPSTEPDAAADDALWNSLKPRRFLFTWLTSFVKFWLNLKLIFDIKSSK